MSARLVLIALLAGVAAPADVEAKPKKSSKTEAKKAKAKKSKKAKRSSKRKKKKREKKVPRIPDKTTNYARNMPRGFHWPPTEMMKKASAICEEQLDSLGIAWQRVKSPERKARIVAPVVVPSMEIGGITYVSAFRRPPHTMDCQFARTLATFGTELHALGVREVKFGSIYRNTTVRVGGKSKNILSRHALGIAMDVMSFTDETGRVVVVKDDYPKDDPLLLAIEEAINNSGKFRVVLTPRNDPTSHHDHFHLEAAIDYSAAELP